MNRDRLIQLVAVLAVILGLLACALISPVIHSERSELNISGTINDKGLSPMEALAVAALGSFRGIAIDALWYQTNKLQQEGKYYEANQDAEWITTLQPRFPQVWVFQSWNMAYNISVGTHTPQERWNWVQKGIDLLRNRGIPNNPQSVPLYRQLGFTFMHKIGMASDTMHWYYKMELAGRWQTLLGSPTEGADTKQILARFAPIAAMADKYVRFNQPTQEIEAALKTLKKDYPDLKTTITQMQVAAPSDLARMLEQKITAWSSSKPAAVAAMKKILKRARAQVARSNANKLQLFLNDYPDAQPVVDQLRAMGLKMDQQTLRDLGRVRMLVRYIDHQTLMTRVMHTLKPAVLQKLLRFDLKPPNHAGLIETLNYLRAKVLDEDYHMDPVFMYQLMREYGPIDWRSPDAQGLYWYAMGVKRGRQIGASPGFDLLNTSRGVVHCLQALMRQGTIVFNPFSYGPHSVDLLPDTRFIPAYEKAMLHAEARAKARGISKGAIRSFKKGYEFFLEYAVRTCYLYGSVSQAQKYYQKLRTEFGDSKYNKRTGIFNLPLPDLVMKLIRRDLDERQVSRIFIGAMLRRGMLDGLATGKLNVYQRFQNVAKAAYEQYQKHHATVNPGAPQNRAAMPPFADVVVNTYAHLMRQPQYSLLFRERLYNNTPQVLQKRAYPKFIDDVRKQNAQLPEKAQLDLSRVFPAPPGVAEEKVNPHLPGTNGPGNSTIKRH